MPKIPFTVLLAILINLKYSRCDQLPSCQASDFHYEFTECDENQGRWRVSVPRPGKCVGGLPNAPTRVKCGISCDAGSYYNTTDLSCSTCPKGTFSLGGATRYSSWDTIPEEFLVESDSFKSYLRYTTQGSESSVDNCTVYGWQAKSKAVASFGGPCVSTMSYSVKLVKPGYLTYKYQYTDKSIMFSFKIQNEQCHTIEESEKYKWPEATEKDEWNTVRVELKAGINIMYWKTVGMDTPMTNQPVLISDIIIMGVEYTSKCTKCLAGFYNNKPGATECNKCPINTYSEAGATKCIACDSTVQYAEAGSSSCKKRVACTQSDYYQYNSACNEEKKTKLMYKWVEPKICREDLSGSAQLPASGTWQDCPPCNPGMTYNHNASGCIFCPPNTYSNGGSGCKKCGASTTPNNGYQYMWWHSFPPNVISECVSYDFDKCRLNGAWKLQGDFVQTVDGNVPNSYLLLSLEVPGFKGLHDSGHNQYIGDVGHIDFVFETHCSSNCEFAFMMSQPQDLVVVEKWVGTQSKQHFRFVVVQNNTYTFTWSFRKIPDQSQFAVSYDDREMRQYEGDFARIYAINVTGTIDGGASSCLSCPKGTEGDGCIGCPSGKYISEEDKSCVECPKNTVVKSHGLAMGNESCQPCGPGLRSSHGHMCYSDCRVQINHQHYDFSQLPKHVLVKGRPLFSSSGTHYYRLFNISLCGQNEHATCSDNVTYGFEGKGPLTKIQSQVCRSTMIPVTEHGSAGFMTTMSVSVGDMLIGVAQNPTYQNITVAKDFVKTSAGKDIHFFYRSPVKTHACRQGRSTTITLRCNRNEKGNGSISVPPSCGDGTCDGCNFHFLWETRLACPVCTQSDYETVKSECIKGEQMIHYIPSSNCLLPGGKSEVPPTKKKCTIIPKELQILIGLTVGLGVTLLALVVYFWKKNRKLEYKYMKLVQSSSDKDDELPVADTCGIEEDEYGEDDGYDNIEYTKGKGLLGKIRAMTASNNKALDDKLGTEGQWTPQ